MKMIYENECGSVLLSGEGNEEFSICEADGLNLPGRERSLVKFYNTNGYKESTAFYGQRVITVSGDIKTGKIDEMKKALKIFSQKGTLKIETESESKEINVDDVSFKFSDVNGMYKKFCVQMTCDSPFFTDCEDITEGAYVRENLISSETVLPAMFSKRTSGGTVKNDGDVRCEPRFVVECVEACDEDGNIIIENTTVGSKIQINHTAQKGERITIDIKNRTITSDLAGDITYSLADGSYLCDMYLERGENYITAVADYGNRNCNVYLVFRNNYTGMVI